MTDESKEAVYTLYRNNPALGRSSYLYDHYKRGLLSLNEPSKEQEAAHAAWRAGRDTANFMKAK